MSFRDEKEFYPYTIIIDSDKLPFQSDLEKRTADQAIIDFIEVIESEKTKSEEFAKKVEDINFKVLFLQKPHSDWHYWDQQYSFADSQKDLVNEAVLGKKAQYNQQFNNLFLSYCALHLLSKGVAYKNKMPYNHKYLMPFRFGKYLALGGFLFAYQWSA